MLWYRMSLVGMMFAVVLAGCSRSDAPDAEGGSDRYAASAPREMPAQPESAPEQSGVPDIADVWIEPEEPVTGQRLEALVEADEPDLLFEYVWYVDGQRLAGETMRTLSGQHVRRDRSIHVEVAPVHEGQRGAPVSAAAVTVVNTPPEITAVRQVSLDGNVLTLQVEAHDADGDTLKYELRDAPQGMRIDDQGRITWSVPEGGEAAYTVVVSDGEREFEFSQVLGFDTQQVE